MRLIPRISNPANLTFDENDLFSRRRLGEGLTNLISNVEEPLVIAVDGEWGAGKTAFLSMWEASLKVLGYPVIRFDAFEHDYFEDPFLALSGEIVALAQSKRRESEPALKKFLDKAAGVTKVLLTSGATLAAKAATLNLIDPTQVGENLVEAVTEEVDQITEDYVRMLLTRHSEQKNSITEFKNALKDLPKLLTNDQNSTKPLIFIIDELDRCRPDFSLQTLERIKHFFSVDGVHFVLGTNINQLENSVNAIYGSGVDSKLYLQKFIHFRAQLTDQIISRGTDVTTRYISHILKNMNYEEEEFEIAKESSEMIRLYAQTHQMNLRSIERIFFYISLSIAFKGGNFAPPYLLGGLCVIKVTNPELFERAKQGRLQYNEIFSLFGFPANAPMRAPSAPLSPVDWWAMATGGSYNGEIASKIIDALQNTGVSADQIISHVANQIIDRLRM